MANRRQVVRVRQDQSFKGRQFTAEVILWAIGWYLMFPISYRDAELMLLDRGVAVDHTTVFRWIQAYAVELGKRIRPRRGSSPRCLRSLPDRGELSGRCLTAEAKTSQQNRHSCPYCEQTGLSEHVR